MTGFWSSSEGEALQASRRYMAALHLGFDLEPPSKRARQSIRRSASQRVRESIADDITLRRGVIGPKWPRPRAALALDISVHSAARNAPRIDNICKWLLDEMTGLIYADDRQVKMLFARLWRARTPSVTADKPEPPGANSLTTYVGHAVERSAKTYVTVQSRADVRANLRAANRLVDPLDPVDRYESWKARDPVEAMMEREVLEDYRAELNPDGSAFDSEQYILTGRQLEFRSQAQLQRGVDQLFSSVMATGAARRDIGSWHEWNPYIFNLGKLPRQGQSIAFQTHLRHRLEERRSIFPQLFPMRTTSGISMVLIEEVGTAKDLDNLVREALPAILDVLRPPAAELPGWIADEPDPATGDVDVPFIEVISIPANETNVEPGTVIFGLSDGLRTISWWERATDEYYSAMEV
jgi:Holliday junction resolvase RusA-like endonuclease